MAPRAARKPWGRRDLPSPFGRWADGTESIGEIIFDPPDGSDPELLVKFLFTAEKLSIQVHPDDCAALDEGARRGKDEAWIVLAADPNATIGIGLTREVSDQALRQAVADGSIEQLVDWRPVFAGDCFYSPAGTIHAIGAGLSLVEIQQNCDVTYRLYDYGRARELHVDEAIAVSRRAPAGPAQEGFDIAPARTRLAGGPAFQVERLKGPMRSRLSPPNKGLWLVLLEGAAYVDDRPLNPGEVWWVDQACSLRLAADADLILAYPGGELGSFISPTA